TAFGRRPTRFLRTAALRCSWFPVRADAKSARCAQGRSSAPPYFARTELIRGAPLAAVFEFCRIAREPDRPANGFAAKRRPRSHAKLSRDSHLRAKARLAWTDPQSLAASGHDGRSKLRKSACRLDSM